jgi:hypothetical protein
MAMASLRHSRSRLHRRRQVVAIEHGDSGEAMAQDPGSDEACHAGADDHGVFQLRRSDGVGL